MKGPLHFLLVLLIINMFDCSLTFYNEKKKKYSNIIPLKRVVYNVNISTNTVTVELTQFYENNNDFQINAQYSFAISDSAAFDKFQAIIDERILEGKILKKGEAKKTFEEEVKKGNTAAITEITSGGDIMKLEIGNINPKEKIQITYSYVEPLKVYLNNFWSFRIFSTTNPRYSPETHRLNDDIKLAQGQLYPWEINVTIDTNEKLLTVEVPSHAKEVSITKENDYRSTIKFKNQNSIPNKDFELYYNTENQFAPSLTVERHPVYTNSYVGMVSFYPKLNEVNKDKSLFDTIFEKIEDYFVKDSEEDGSFIPSETEERKKIDDEIESTLKSHTNAEILFIADRSSSMGGDRISKLKYTLEKLVRMLPDDSYFNIYSFGYNFSPMYQESSKTSIYRDNACAQILQFTANMGGTEIFKPINAAINSPKIEGYPKVIFLLTDGEVSNSDEIISLVSMNTNLARVFSIGIGNGISPYFIKNVGLRGKGGYEFVRDSENLEEKTRQMVKKMLSPHITNFKVEFNRPDIVTLPDVNKLSYIVKNEPFMLFFRFTSSDDFGLLSTKLSFFNSFTEKVETSQLTIENKLSYSGDKLHKLYYKAVIDENTYQANKLTDNQIAELSIQYQVLSKATAFLLILKNNTKAYDDNINQEKTVNCEIPNHYTIDYQSHYTKQYQSTNSKLIAISLIFLLIFLLVVL